MKFKTSGKEILEPGWRVVFETETPTEASEAKEGEEGGEASETLLPTFTEGETGEHIPELREKQTQPPEVLHRSDAPACYGDRGQVRRAGRAP